MPHILLLCALFSASPPTAHAVRAGSPPRINGVLDDEVWLHAPVQSGFTQQTPVPHGPITHTTSFQVAFDEDALYVAIRCEDPDPSGIVARLTRRDRSPESDRIEVAVDARHDGRSAFQFQVNAAGVQADESRFDDTQASREWDGVWSSEVNVDARGWTAELRIGWTELRFIPSADARLGLQVKRYIPRLRETHLWSFIAPGQNAWVSRFGILSGVTGLTPRRGMALTPFLSAGLLAKEGLTLRRPAVGVDARLGLTSDLTLDAALMPDFGQVETDGAVINLGQFETFFPERRPFFQQGSELLTSSTAGGWGHQNVVLPFYSRRLGANRPILGASKITGRLGPHLTVGMLDAVTWRGWDAPSPPALEHLGIHRVSLQVAETTTGLLLTHAVRPTSVGEDVFVAGADTVIRPDNGDYVLSFLGLGSVHTTDVIRPTRRPKAGAGGKAHLARAAGPVVGGVEYEVWSPDFNVNDLGYQQRADLQHVHGELGLRQQERGFFFNNASMVLGADAVGTFDLTPLRASAYANGGGTLINNAGAGAGIGFTSPSWDDLELRDRKALLKRPMMFGTGLGVNSDGTLALVVGAWGNVGNTDAGYSGEAGAWATWAPLPPLELSASFNAAQRHGDVRLREDRGPSWLVAERDTVFCNAVARGTLALSRTVSIQTYAQTLLSSGEWRQSRTIHKAPPAGIGVRQVVDPATVPPDASVPSSSWRSGSLLLQAVMRHEFHPGSTLYVVYLHRSLDEKGEGGPTPQGAWALLGATSESRVEAKMSFRL